MTAQKKSTIKKRKLIMYIVILATSRPSEEVVKQIALDLPRTSRWLVADNSQQFKERLKRVLWAFANYNEEVGYCQGLNRIACLALEHLSEEVSFTLRANFAKKHFFL